MTRSGETKEFDSEVYSFNALHGKGWSDCDAPVPVVPDPVVPPPPRYSKYELRLAMRAAGIEVVFDAYLAAHPDVAKLFDAAQDLAGDNPIVQGVKLQLMESNGITEAAATALLTSAEIAR